MPTLSARDTSFMAKFPEIFGPGPWHNEPTPICWGLQIGDGWMPVLDRLCEDLVQIIREDDLRNFRVHQVKEKFGSLRVHAHGGDQATWARINLAEHESMTICEACGAPAEWTQRVATLCRQCWKKGG